MSHELVSRGHEDGRTTVQPEGVGSEAYLNGTPQGPTPEDARLPAHRASGSERRMAILFALPALRSVPQAGSQFRGRSKRFMRHPG
jgi:hypothetical protein